MTIVSVAILIDTKSSYVQILTPLLTIFIIASFFYFVLIFILGKIIKNDFVAISINIGLVISLIGFLLRVMRWPGGFLQINIGFLLLFLGFVVVFLNKIKI